MFVMTLYEFVYFYDLYYHKVVNPTNLIHIPYLLDSSTKNVKFIIPSFTNSNIVYLLAYFPSILKKFLPSLHVHCKKFAIYFSIRLNP